MMIGSDWYRRVDERYRKKAYELAWFLCPDHEIITEQIFPDAIDQICTGSARNCDRRGKRHSKRHWKLFFTNLQLLQIAILQAAAKHEQTVPHTDTRCLIRYIRFFACYALGKSSFYVTSCFVGSLSNGSHAEILRLYTDLDPSPDCSQTRDDRSVTKARADLRKVLFENGYHDLFLTSGQELSLKEQRKAKDDLIYRILERMVPWETDCLPSSQSAWEKQIEKTHKEDKAIRLVEAARCHVSIEQAQCLEEVKRWNSVLVEAFQYWRLPSPKNPYSNPNDDPWQPPDLSNWKEREREIMKEILWRDDERERGERLRFKVVIDGEVKASLDSEKSNFQIMLPSAARYLEIIEQESGLVAANCHLMDPQDLPEAGWKSSVEIGSGRKITFEFFPQDDGEEFGISTHVQLTKETSFAEAAARFWQGLSEVSFRWAVAAVCLMVVLSSTVLVGKYRIFPEKEAITKRYERLTKRYERLTKRHERLTEQHETLIRRLSFSTVGKSAQIDLWRFPHDPTEAAIDWGDPLRPDPVGGRQIVTERVKSDSGSPFLPTVFHEYGLDEKAGQIPPEGRRSKVLLYEGPSSKKFTAISDILILPDRVVTLDPSVARLKITTTAQDNVVTPITEVRLQASALTADVHFLARDIDTPIYRYLGKIPPPPFDQKATELTYRIDTSRFGGSGQPFWLTVISTNEFALGQDGTVAWHDIPQTVPRDDVQLRHAGIILSPTQGAVVSSVGEVRAKIFLPGEVYAAVAICPEKADLCWVQNKGRMTSPDTEFRAEVDYGGRDKYQVFVGITYDPDLFKKGPLNQRPQKDSQGRPVYWLGPVETTHE